MSAGHQRREPDVDRGEPDVDRGTGGPVAHRQLLVPDSLEAEVDVAGH